MLYIGYFMILDGPHIKKNQFRKAGCTSAPLGPPPPPPRSKKKPYRVKKIQRGSETCFR